MTARKAFPRNAPKLIPDNTLITTTPEADRQLAMQLARLRAKVNQIDTNVRKRLREVYANDAGMPLQLTLVTAEARCRPDETP